jgi:hypothetical protein
MKTWFTSLNGAITLAALSLLSFIGYAMMEFRYFLGKWIPGSVAAAIETIVFLLLIAIWLRALFVANAGRRGGLIALLSLSLFTILIFIYDLQFMLNTPMPKLEQLALIGMLVAGVVASVALVPQLRRKQASV